MKNNSGKIKVLVAGGAGFLGSHLCERLIHQGKEVFCIDNLSTGSIKNVERLLNDPNFRFIKHDIRDPLPEIFEIKEIYNFACAASPLHYQKDPINIVKTNILGTCNLLDLAKMTGAKILQASTSEVYGSADMHPQKENYNGNVNPIGLRACYDEGKRCAESLFFDYYRLYNLNIKVARIFNTYGPYLSLNDGRVVSNFIINALQNKPLIINGTGQQTRSFCYVDDLIEGILLLMDSPNHFTGPVNLGNDQECSIFDLAQKIIKITEASSEIIYKKELSDDPQRRCPHLGLAKEALRYQPKMNLEMGLKKTVDYFKTFI